MKEYSQIISRMTSTPWLIHPDSLAVLVDIVNMHLRGERLDKEEIRLRIEADDKSDREHSRVEVAGGVGVLSVTGPIFPKANIMTEVSGATDLETFRADLQQLVQNDAVRNIVLDLDSPGGSSDMMEETGAFIRDAAKVKPIYAVANTQANSGAYWLGSQATQFYGTPSAKVGSIGVYTVHEDRSKANENEGRKVTYISAGKYKTAGNPDEPLSEEAREYIEEHVNETMETFVNAVATGRGLDRDKVESFADGRVFSAKRAHLNGMLDGVKTMDEVLDSLIAENNMPVGVSTLTGAMARSQYGVATSTDGENYVITTGGGHVRTYSDNTTNVSHDKELEHSEPGTGSPPEPREDEKDVTEMTRIPTPPIAFEEEVSMKGLLDRLRAEGITLGDDATEDDVVAAVKELQTNAANAEAQLAPLREAEKRVQDARAFEEHYPEQASRLARLEAKDREHEARTFAEGFSRFKTESGENKPQGFSSLVINMVEGAHLAISNREFTHNQLGELLTKIGEAGIVDYSERGSSRVREEGELVGSNPRQQFGNLVAEIMKEDGLDQQAAINVAAEQNPDLFEAYLNKSPSSQPSR